MFIVSTYLSLWVDMRMDHISFPPPPLGGGFCRLREILPVPLFPISLLPPLRGVSTPLLAGASSFLSHWASRDSSGSLPIIILR